MNAKQELIEHINNRDVKYVRVARVHWDREDVVFEGTLDSVLPHLNFEYDNGYGSQELEGVVWYADGSWSDRREYDGSEWWEHHVCPPLPPGASS